MPLKRSNGSTGETVAERRARLYEESLARHLSDTGSKTRWQLLLERYVADGGGRREIVTLLAATAPRASEIGRLVEQLLDAVEGRIARNAATAPLQPLESISDATGTPEAETRLERDSGAPEATVAAGATDPVTGHAYTCSCPACAVALPGLEGP